MQDVELLAQALRGCQLEQQGPAAFSLPQDSKMLWRFPGPAAHLYARSECGEEDSVAPGDLENAPQPGLHQQRVEAVNGGQRPTGDWQLQDQAQGDSGNAPPARESGRGGAGEEGQQGAASWIRGDGHHVKQAQHGMMSSLVQVETSPEAGVQLSKL